MTRFTLVSTLALLLAVATPAQSYFLTCSEFRAAVLTGDRDLLFITSGYAAGAVDFYAGLSCFAGTRQCSCLVDLFQNQAGPLGAESARQINRFIAEGNGNSSAWAAIIAAAQVLCP
ncbi:MAG: hypothetical protein AB1689_12135 [Thermodesulfobacteriota bacterium]